MSDWFWPRLRHPLYPGLRITRAARAAGRHSVVAGTFPELALAASVGACASRAVFILSDEGAPLPSPTEREQLWQWFPVPSFVMVLGADGRLKAYECEARDGLHVVDNPGRAGDPEPSLCPCGRPGRRVNAPFTRSRPSARRPQPAHFLSA